MGASPIFLPAGEIEQRCCDTGDLGPFFGGWGNRNRNKKPFWGWSVGPAWLAVGQLTESTRGGSRRRRLGRTIWPCLYGQRLMSRWDY